MEMVPLQVHLHENETILKWKILNEDSCLKKGHKVSRKGPIDRYPLAIIMFPYRGLTFLNRRTS